MMRVFVTVGTQLPFDRLVTAIDEWGLTNPNYHCFAQIGASTYQPSCIAHKKFIDLEEYQQKIEECDLLVAHAGMGAILSALESGKPIVIMPRKASLREHRNDHQIATANRFLEMGKVLVANESQDLHRHLTDFASNRSAAPLGPHASKELIEAVSSFLSR